MSARAYPLPRPDEDPRFTVGLHLDVAKVLQEHGYPEPSGVDLVDLGMALFRFIYAAEEQPAPAAEDDSPLTFANYRDAIPRWQRRVESAESAGDLAAADRSRWCLKLLQERVMRAEVVAQRGEWHVDVSDEALAVLASHSHAGVAR